MSDEHTAAGWAWRASSAVATGTTGLTISLPAGTVDGDVLVFCLNHKGTDWAVVPGDWILAARETTGVIRVEVYVKRASSEGASYAVTGLATAAIGWAVTYTGGPASGDLVSEAVAEVTTAGSSYRIMATSLDVSIDTSLVLIVTGTNANSGITGVGHLDSLEDPDLLTIPERIGGGTSGLRMELSDAIKMVAGPAGLMRHDVSAASASVMVVVALRPTPVSLVSAGSRYYFTNRRPARRVEGPLAGAWNATFTSPRAWGWAASAMFLLHRSKSGAGPLGALDFVTNQQGNHDVMLWRGMTPPLRRQTIDGTVDLVWKRAAYFVVAAGNENTAVVKTRLHIFITKGQTTEVRHTLLRRHVDATSWTYLSPVWAALGAAAALVAGTCEDGDSVMVELGARIVSSPTPTPTYPPTEWTYLDVMAQGATMTAASVTTFSGVPYVDGVVGGTSDVQVAFMDFSHEFQELTAAELLARATADAVVPAHVTPATALEVLQLPYKELTGWDTTQVAYGGRPLWYTYTATFTGRLGMAAFGSNHNARVYAFEGTVDALTFLSPVAASTRGASDNGAFHNQWIDVVEGTQYWFLLNTQVTTAQGASSGGSTRFSLYRQRDPKVDDIYVPGAMVLLVDPCGTVKNLQSGLASFAPTAVAIDYRGESMVDQEDSEPHTGERLYVGVHTGHFVQILDLPSMDIGEAAGVDVIEDPLAAIEHVAALAIDGAGRLVVGAFGNGYLHVSGNPPAPAFLNAESNAPAVSAIQRLPAVNGDNQAGAPFTAETFEPTAGPASPHTVALDPDNDDLAYYTAGGWYLAGSRVGSATEDLRAQVIKRYSFLSGQVADFATVPLDQSPNAGLRGLCVLPGGHGLLVCNGSRIEWLNAAGTIVRTYRSQPPDLPRSFASVQVTSDGRHLWGWDDAHAELIQWELLTGAQTRRNPTYLAPGVGVQIALYQPNGIELCW